MKIRIYMGFFRRLFYSRRMKKMRFYFKKDKGLKYYQKHIDDKNETELIAVRKFCRVRLLRYSILDDRMERSSSYRIRFLKEKRGIFGSDIFICAYCGRPVPLKKLKIDHIVSVYNAGNSKVYRKILALRGIENVNDIRNLAPSCNKCNAIKSSSGGLWIIRGMFGRSWIRSLLKETVLLVLGGFALYWWYNWLRNSVDYHTIIMYINSLINK